MFLIIESYLSFEIDANILHFFQYLETEEDLHRFPYHSRKIFLI